MGSRLTCKRKCKKKYMWVEIEMGECGNIKSNIIPKMLTGNQIVFKLIKLLISNGKLSIREIKIKIMSKLK